VDLSLVSIDPTTARTHHDAAGMHLSQDVMTAMGKAGRPAGGVLLVETIRRTGLETALARALGPWSKPRAVHDPGKTLLDVNLGAALGGDCPADMAMLRAEPQAFGRVASDPTVSRLSAALASDFARALAVIRAGRAEVRRRVWESAGERAPGAGGQMIVDIDGVLVNGDDQCSGLDSRRVAPGGGGALRRGVRRPHGASPGAPRRPYPVD
jgi:hypothetical protein